MPRKIHLKRGHTMSSVSNRAGLSPRCSDAVAQAAAGGKTDGFSSPSAGILALCGRTQSASAGGALSSAPALPLRTPPPRFGDLFNTPPPSLLGQAQRLVPDPLRPPSADLARVAPNLLQPQGMLTIRGARYRPIRIDELQPGDIAFNYRAVGRSWRQKIINLGERVQNVVRPDRAGSANVLHAFVVLQTYPALGKVRVADAATGEAPYGVLFTDLELGEHQTQDAFHLYYRFKNPRMGQRIANIARNWATEFSENFSSKNALNSLVQQPHLDQRTQERLLRLSKSSVLAKPMVNADQSPYEVMCSEFVTNVGAAAAMSLYAEDHPGVALGDPETLRALVHGPGGAVFNANPASMTPSALAQRLATDPDAEIVGYMYSDA